MGTLDYSVLLPLYYKDNPEWFKDSLYSMLEQSAPPKQVVIIHEYPNGSRLDAVISEARNRYPDIEVADVLDESLVGQGLGGVLAAGVERCSCSLVARMDSDDIAKPDRCERQLAAFSVMPELDLVGGWIDEFEDDPSVVVSIRKVPEFEREIRAFSCVRCPFNHPTVMYRKAAVLAAGNYAALPRCEDYELWVRMLSTGCKAMNLQESLIYYRTNDDQLKRRKDRKLYDIRKEIKRGMRQRGEMSVPRFAYSMSLDFANYHAPMPLFAWGTRHLLRAKKGN